MEVGRRDLIVRASLAGLGTVLATGAARGQVATAAADLYQVDDPKTIMDAARAIINEDYIGVLITVDEQGMPRARPVGVAPLKDGDWSLWVSTKRGSRKQRQIEANPRAALHFGFDDTPNGHKDAYYASFMGLARVYTDNETIRARGPGPKYRSLWPKYPDDMTLIELKPQRLEVMGKGIVPSEDIWQPQGVMLGR